MSDKYVSMIPEYMKNFHCIGSACEDTCCSGWSIPIDRHTYFKYSQKNNDEFSDVMKYIALDEADPNSGTIPLDGDACCPMLSCEGLCRIQLKHGEDNLSSTCMIYPRILNIVDQQFELSAKLSCPEIARLALGAPEGIRFVEEKMEISERYNPSVVIEINNSYWPARVFLIELLQDRRYPLEDRLIVMGLFCQKIDPYFSAQEHLLVEEIIEEYRTKLNDLSYMEGIHTISKKTEVKVDILNNLFKERAKFGFTQNRYKECFNEMVEGLDVNESSDTTVLSKKYEIAYNNFYLPFMNSYGYILENYIVNYVFLTAFPQEKEVFKQFCTVVTLFSMIKMHLIGMASYHQGLNVDLVLKCIQSFTKIAEHNAVFMQSINDLVSKSDMNMAHMSILIKD